MNEEDQALYCGSALLPATATGVMMFMPAGIQQITPFAGAGGQQVRVLVDPAGAAELEKQRAALMAKGARPYFDFEHEDKGASFWPTEFFWAESPSPGIYARGEWSDEGQRGVEGKKWRQFSPVFHVDNKRGNPARIVARDFAKPNMGGLVNDPAFKQISPLWAKNAGGAHPSPDTETTNMKPEELAALQAKNTELANEVARLKGEQAAIKAKNENDEFIAARIEAKQSEIKANAATLELEALKAKSAEQGAELLKQREANAKALVKAAVDRGAIAAKDTDTIAAWEKDITESPERGALLAKMGGQPAMQPGRITPSASDVRVTATAPNDIMGGYAALVAKNAAIPLSAATVKEKDALAREAAGLFAKDIAGNKDIEGMTMDEALKAADYSDANLSVGLLSGTLVMQRTLPLFLQKNPMLGAITTDFSAEPGMLNQTTSTRIVLAPAVQTYDPTLGTDGRPNGWITVTPAQTVDVNVTLDEYVGIPIVFGAATLSQTTRKLFDEQAPLAINALGRHATNKLSALMTAANFNAFKGITIGTGATTSGSKSITMASNTIIYPGQPISGTGIPTGTYIESVQSATAATLTRKATATGSSLTFTLGGGKVPVTYTTYVKALASFAIADLDAMAGAFDTIDVPMEDRFAALNSAYYRKLGSDAQVNAILQGTGDLSYLTERRLPKMSNFELINSPWMPGASNQTGFAGHKASLVFKSRLPMDINDALPGGGAPGTATTVTDPGSGLTMLLVQYGDRKGNYAEWRPEILLGASVGDRRGGLVITSA